MAEFARLSLMKKLLFHTLFVSLFFASVYPVLVSGQEKNSSDALTGLMQYRALEKEAYNNIDMQGLLRIFSEDIEFSSNGLPLLRGHEAIEEFFSDFWSTYHAELIEVVDDEVFQYGDLLIVWGHFSVKLTPKNGDPAFIDKGRMLSIFKKENDGMYRLWKEAGFDAGTVSN